MWVRFRVVLEPCEVSHDPERDGGEAWWDVAVYRAGFHSVIKQALEGFDVFLYRFYFESRRPVVKPYTFAVLFPEGRFEGGRVYFKRVVFLFSAVDPVFTAALYNFIVSRDGCCLHLLGNDLRIAKFEFSKMPSVSGNRLTVKTLSPVLVRSMDNPRHYLVPDCVNRKGDEGFLASLRHNVGQVVGALQPSLLEVVDGLSFEPVDCRFTVAKYRKDNQLLKFPCFKGIFTLRGEPELLSFLLGVGVGTRRSQGFGMIDIHDAAPTAQQP